MKTFTVLFETIRERGSSSGVSIHSVPGFATQEHALNMADAWLMKMARADDQNSLICFRSATVFEVGSGDEFAAPQPMAGVLLQSVRNYFAVLDTTRKVAPFAIEKEAEVAEDALRSLVGAKTLGESKGVEQSHEPKCASDVERFAQELFAAASALIYSIDAGRRGELDNKTVEVEEKLRKLVWAQTVAQSFGGL